MAEQELAIGEGIHSEEQVPIEQEAEELINDVMAEEEDIDYFAEEVGQDDYDDEVDFVHLSQEPESDDVVDNDLPADDDEQDEEVLYSDKPSVGATPRPAVPDDEARPGPAAFDFSQLTPLHVRHSLPPPRERTPVYRDPRGSYKVTELYKDQFSNRFGFSPLPPRQSATKSPVPFSKRESSPATEEDADMWRSMLSRPQEQSHLRGGHARQSSHVDDDSEAESEENMPEATSRTIGEATMMQSEDFSMVSLSSLPSAKDINSSMLGQSQGDRSHSHTDQSMASSRRPSKLHKAVTFSSPLTQSFHSHSAASGDGEDEGEDGEVDFDYDLDEDDEQPLPQKPAPQKSSLRSSFLREFADFKTPVITTPPRANETANRLDIRVSYAHNNPHRQQQTPNNAETEARLPTPSSGENHSSPVAPSSVAKVHSDISYPDVEEEEQVDEPIYQYPNQDVQNTPARSEAEMSTPPATPERDQSPRTKRMREASLLSSGSKRSWVEEPKSARMIALENRWQEDRDNVIRTLEQAKAPAVMIESDEEMEDKEEDELHSDPLEPGQNQTEDVWQDISASYEDGGSQLPRRQRPTHARPTHVERPSKAARTTSRQSPGAAISKKEKEYEEVTTPRKSFAAEENMASVQRRARSKADVAALFGRLGGASFNPPTHNSPAKPSPLRNNVFIDGSTDETEISALSDVRQLRNEMKFAQRRPPFPLARGTTTKIPTKLKSIDDTMTTQDEDEEEAEDDDEIARDQSVISFTGRRQPTGVLFSGSNSREPSIKAEFRPAIDIRAVPRTETSIGEGIFTYIWRTLTFSHPYIPLPRPTHPTLADADKYPLLPNVWAWSHTHWQTLDNLYQYYKRKPSRFSPSRTTRPNNTGLMTSQWQKLVDIQMSHWGYRVRLESTHIALAILFHSLLVLPSQDAYAKVYNKPLEYRHQDQTERKGERISEWDVLLHFFAIVAGEMLREDEREGRRIRREEVEFVYRLKGEKAWKSVRDVPAGF